MKKQITAIMIAGSLLMPIGAMAEEAEDLTIRVMEMNENSVEAVTRNIELPEMASEEAADALQTRTQSRVRNREMVEDGGDQLMLQEQERLRENFEEHEQDREQMRENAREQLEQREQMQDIDPSVNPGQGGPL
ncbi:MAG: hypothetical protein OQL09_07000 [Gammaproteobacteria bacterium]|nr:hypothetical protein [Gammaproteobacteria bacterium]